MKPQTLSIVRGVCTYMFGLLMFCMVMGIALTLVSNASFAQSNDSPPANTVIGNQASATYLDSNGNTRTVTSNTVETTVQQVAAVTITSGVTKTVSPGGQVSFPHTLTNSGNGIDSYNLSTTEGSGDYNFDNLSIYADDNADGVPDDITSPIIQTPNVAGGDQYNFVVVAEVPTGASSGDSQTFDVTGTSAFDNTQFDTQENTSMVSQDAVIDVITSISPSHGKVGDQLTVTLTFTNNGNTDGSNLVLNNPLPVGFTYMTGTGLWSGSATTMTDAADGDESGISYKFDSGSTTVTATVAQLNAGQQGTLSFDVTVDNGLEGQVVNNMANYTHDDLTGNQNTNTVSFQVEQNYGVAAVASEISQGPVSQGANIDFVNEYTNSGSSIDRYNVEVENSTYPQGTTFTLFHSDGNGNATSPLTDSNNDGIPDEGLVAAGDNFEVILRVSLPSDVSGDNSGNGYSVLVVATSVGDSDEGAQVTDKLADITASSVDLTSGAAADDAGADGEGTTATGESNPVTYNSLYPGETTSFTLFVTNTSSKQDNYNLAASTDGSDFSAGLPGGWTIDFRDSNNNVIANTGPVNAGANKEVTAMLTIAEGVTPGQQSIYFRTRSVASNVADVLNIGITVLTKRRLTLAATQNGQIAPGGSKIYTHTLTNEGKVDENVSTNSTIELELGNSAADGFTAAVYVDNNSDGLIDSGDEIVTTAGNSAELPASVGTLAPEDDVKLIVKVTATGGVNNGTSNTTTLTARDSGGGNIVNGASPPVPVEIQDFTTVVAGNLIITKTQSLDGSTYGANNLDANPGDLLYYRIMVTNQGSAAVTSVVILDDTPVYTTQEGTITVNGSGSPVIDSEPGDGNAGTIEVSSTSLGAGNSFTIEYAIEIDS